MSLWVRLELGFASLSRLRSHFVSFDGLEDVLLGLDCEKSNDPIKFRIARDATPRRVSKNSERCKIFKLLIVSEYKHLIVFGLYYPRREHGTRAQM